MMVSAAAPPIVSSYVTVASMRVSVQWPRLTLNGNTYH